MLHGWLDFRPRFQLHPVFSWWFSSWGAGQAAALALLRNSDLGARDIVEKALEIAADICVFTNQNVVVEELPSTSNNS